MDRILFLIPPNITFDEFARPAYHGRLVRKVDGVYGSLITDMPLGAFVLSAYVKRHVAAQTGMLDFNVVLNQLDTFSHASFRDLFRSQLSSQAVVPSRPTIVAISALFTAAYGNVIDLADCCREVFPDALIIAGGAVPTNLYRELLQDCEAIDALCYGEGEKPLLAFLQSADKWQCLEHHPSWITRLSLQRGAVPVHDFIDDLDEIPFPDYGLCDTAAYSLNPAITAYAGVREKRENFHVITSRGCPHRCCFCSSHTVHGRRVRFYSLERVRQDLTRLKHEHQARTVVFQDDHFLADKRRALAIIHMLTELELRAVFQNGLALHALDRELLQALKRAGVEQLLLAVESGSETVLRQIMHKPLTLPIIRRVVGDCRDLDIYTGANVLIGLPGETKRDIEEARAFLRTLDVNWFHVFCATPLAGSEMLAVCHSHGYIRGGYSGRDFKTAIIETEEFTADYIQEMTYAMNLELNFIHNPDVRLGQYRTALAGFENAIRARDDHAFAYFCAGVCHQHLGDATKGREYVDKAKAIVSDNQFWRRYAESFDVSALLLPV